MDQTSESVALPPAPRRHGHPRRTEQRAARTLSRAAIIDAALEVLDAEGLSAVTMRRVAEALGTGPASLYAHVADKDEMVAAVYDRVLSEVPLPEWIDPEHWQEQLKDLVRAAWVTLRRHRDIARVGLGEIPTGDGALRAVDATLAILRAGAVSATVAGLAVDVLALYSTASAFEDSLETFPANEAEAEVFHQQMGEFFAALPAERYPNVVAMAGALTGPSGDERFEFGLDLLVRGIASTVKADKKRAKKKR